MMIAIAAVGGVGARKQNDEIRWERLDLFLFKILLYGTAIITTKIESINFKQRHHKLFCFVLQYSMSVMTSRLSNSTSCSTWDYLWTGKHPSLWSFQFNSFSQASAENAMQTSAGEKLQYTPCDRVSIVPWPCWTTPFTDQSASLSVCACLW